MINTASATSTVIKGKSIMWQRRSTLITAACVSQLALHMSAYAQPAPTGATYTIAAAPLGTVLSQFASQAGITLSFDADQTRGKQSAGLSGVCGIDVCLARLLNGSGLAPVNRGNSNYVLRTLPVGGVVTLDPVTVSEKVESAWGPAAGYVATRSATGTKSDTALIETPQSISVVTRAQMDAQNVQSVPQALRYTPGIYAEQRGVNTDALEYIYSRGFQADEYWNGLRLPRSGFTINSMDQYLFERVEVLRGPASVLYGQASPGGLVNLVSKRPTDEPLHEVMVQTGSYGRAQAGFDFSGPVNDDKTVLYRVTADGFDTGAQVDHVRQQRVAIAPTITLRPNADNRLTIFMNYQNDPRSGVYSYVPAQGTVLPGRYSISRKLFTGDTDFNTYRKEQSSAGYEFEHRFNDAVTFKQNLRYMQNNVHINGLDTYGLNATQDAILREVYTHDAQFNAFTLDNQLLGKFNTGAVAHQVTTGLDYQQTRNQHKFVGQGDALGPELSLANPQYGVPVSSPDFLYGSSSLDRINQLGVYAQDQMRLDKWAFLLGARHDWVDSSVRSLKTDQKTTQDDHKLTWRTGVVYLFDNGLAPYASYSTSFQPSSGTDANGSGFKPTEGRQYEVGVKYQPTGYDSFITASLFHLTQKNVLTTDPTNTRFNIQTGEVRSQGLELEGHAALTSSLNLVASYTYTDIKNTKSNTANKDHAPVGIPQHMGALWVDYALPGRTFAGVQVAAGARYLGTSYGTQTGAFKVPATTLVDLSLRYDLAQFTPVLKGMSTSLTVSNLFDKNYIATCLDISSCAFGAGRVVLANAKYRW